MTRIDGNKIFHDDDDEDTRPKCYNCGFDMIDITACHMRCPNCGTEHTCSDA